MLALDYAIRTHAYSRLAHNAAMGGLMWYDGEAESVSIALLACQTIEYDSTGLVRTSYNRYSQLSRCSPSIPCAFTWMIARGGTSWGREGESRVCKAVSYPDMICISVAAPDIDEL